VRARKASQKAVSTLLSEKKERGRTPTRDAPNSYSRDSPRSRHAVFGEDGEDGEDGIRSSLVWLSEALIISGSGTDGRQFQCPAHRDATPSLAVAPGRTGVLVLCRAGCGTTSVLAALGLRTSNLYDPPPMSPAAWIAFAGVHIDYPELELAGGSDPSERLEAIHPYGEHYKLERWRSSSGGKRLLWFRRDQAGCWIPGLGGAPTSQLPLYREPDVRICAATDEPLYVVESESSVDALNNAGRYGTTWAGGASTPPLAKLFTALDDVPDVRVIADNDAPGIRCAQAILTAVPHATGWLPPQPGTDVRDLLATDPTLDTLQQPITEQRSAAGSGCRQDRAQDGAAPEFLSPLKHCEGFF
jgi:hypothetical protein